MQSHNIILLYIRGLKGLDAREVRTSRNAWPFVLKIIFYYFKDLSRSVVGQARTLFRITSFDAREVRTYQRLAKCFEH